MVASGRQGNGMHFFKYGTFDGFGDVDGTIMSLPMMKEIMRPTYRPK